KPNMYFAQSQAEFNTPLYVSIFNSLANGRGDSYKSEINSVLREAKQVFKGEKEIYSVRNDYYNLISLLVTKGNSLFSHLNESDISATDYQEVLEVLTESQKD